MHKSGSTDPNSAAGPHRTVQLTNSALDNAGRTHLLHFRPESVENSFFYVDSMSRQEVERLQAKRFAARYKKNKGNKDKKDPPGGGAGAASTSSTRGGSSGGGSQQSSRGGGGSSSSNQKYKSRGQYGHSYTWQFYSVEGLSQHFGFLVPQVWHGIFDDVVCQGLTDRLFKFSRITLPVIGLLSRVQRIIRG